MARWVLLFTLALATAGAGAQSTTAETSLTTTSAATSAPTSTLQTGGTAETSLTTTSATTSAPTSTLQTGGTTETSPITTSTTTSAPTSTLQTGGTAETSPITTSTTTSAPTSTLQTGGTAETSPTTTSTTTSAPASTLQTGGTAETTPATTAPSGPDTTDSTATTTTPATTTTTPATTTTTATTTIVTTDSPTTDTTTIATTTSATATTTPSTTTPTTPTVTSDSPTTDTTTTATTTSATATTTPSTTTPAMTIATDSPTTDITTTATTTSATATTTPTTITVTTDATTTTTTTTPNPPTNTTTPDPPTTNTTTTTTIPPIDTTSASPTPLKCENDGHLQDGVCLCPDKWTGETCSERNFCSNQSVGGFNFSETVIGRFAYSAEECNGSAAGTPQASIRCTIQNGQPEFQPPPQVLQCDQTLSDIQQNLTSVADLEILASSAQILTSNSEQLTAENVTTAAQIANTLLLFPNASENVRVAAITTVSQLLGANTTSYSDQNNATLVLTQTLEQVSVASPESQVVQPNLVVQSAQIPAVDTQGVQFTALSGQSSNFNPGRIQLNTNTSAVEVENGFVPEALILVQFPAGAARSRQAAPNVSVGFVLYQNDRFFRSKRYNSERITVRVLSATVRHEGSVQQPHVEMAFTRATINGVMMQDFACVFWDYSLEDWSTVGCEKGNASDGLLRCSCNHTTNFAALWSYRQTYRYADALHWISIIGLVVSVVGLVVTIIHHVSENVYRGSRDNNKSMKLTQLYIYISLLAFIITYLAGAENHSRMADIPTSINSSNNVIGPEEYVVPDRGSCTAVAALLHFFLLATFMWTSIYGTELVLVLRPLHRTLPPNWTTGSVAVGWGVPVVVMVITLAATYRVEDPLGYRQEEFCWLAGMDQDKHFDFAKPMFWGFILPLGLILLYNVVLLVQVSLTTCRTDPNLNSTSKLSFKKKFLISFSLAVILGLSWILGYLVLIMSGTANLVFSIIFCLCTTTQGFLIFLLFTARKPTFKSAVWRSAHYVSSFSRKFSSTSYDLHRNSETSISMGSYKDLRQRQESEA